MDNNIFRKKSLDSINNPGELDAYLCVTNPSIWSVLIAIALLLTGAVIWACVADIDVKLDSVAVSNGTDCCCYVSEKDIASVSIGTAIVIDNEEYIIENINGNALAAETLLNDYAMSIAGFMRGEYVYEAELGKVSVPKGNYPCSIITESISPISFLFSSVN